MNTPANKDLNPNPAIPSGNPSGIIDVGDRNITVSKTKLVDKDDLPESLQKSGLDGKMVIHVRDVAISKGSTHHLYPINCKFYQGKTTVILGGTGSGKDAFFHILLGQRSYTSGTFYINNDLWEPPASLLVTLGLSKMAAKMGGGQKLPIAYVDYHIPPIFGSVSSVLKNVPEKLMSILGIKPLFPKKLKSLSTWQLVRVLLAGAIASQHPFVAVDGRLFNALDGKQSERLRLLLKQLQSEYGFGLIINTDNGAIARAMADDIMIMNRGFLEQFGDARDVYQNPINKFVLEMFSDVPINVFQGGLIGNSTLLLDNGLTISMWGLSPDDANKEVYLCIRPEDFHQSAKGTFALNVLFIEPSVTGKIVYGYLQTGDFKGSKDTEYLVSAYLSADSSIAVGDTINLTVAQEKLSVMDMQTRQPLTREV